MKQPLILEIKGNALDDGPGIRSVVFFKGCPLSCRWCHNPESKRTAVEIGFDPAQCVDCGTCREVCPEGALDRENPAYIDRKKCTLCFACVEECPSGALERVGRSMSVAEIMAGILPDKPFFDTSGGGVTLSGGEPSLFMEFTAELLAAVKKEDIHVLMETCGYFDPDRFMSLLYPRLDMIYFDLKIMDEAAHKKYCGVPNQRIKTNFLRLLKATRADGKVLLPRTPLVPGITDTRENLEAVAAFLKQEEVKEAALLAYNPLWHDKTAKIGAENPCREDPDMTVFSDKKVLEKSREIFAAAGITT